MHGKGFAATEPGVVNFDAPSQLQTVVLKLVLRLNRVNLTVLCFDRVRGSVFPKLLIFSKHTRHWRSMVSSGCI